MQGKSIIEFVASEAVEGRKFVELSWAEMWIGCPSVLGLWSTIGIWN